MIIGFSGVKTRRSVSPSWSASTAITAFGERLCAPRLTVVRLAASAGVSTGTSSMTKFLPSFATTARLRSPPMSTRLIATGVRPAPSCTACGKPMEPSLSAVLRPTTPSFSERLKMIDPSFVGANAMESRSAKLGLASGAPRPLPFSWR